MLKLNLHVISLEVTWALVECGVGSKFEFRIPKKSADFPYEKAASLNEWHHIFHISFKMQFLATIDPLKNFVH